MATVLDPRSLQPDLMPDSPVSAPTPADEAKMRVYYDEPPVKPPPLMAVGVLAWVRANLFRTAFDSILTIITAFLLVSLIGGLIVWTIGEANWLVAIRNLRLFMLGTYPPDEAWRLGLVTLFASFAAGYTLYAYTRLKLHGWIGIAIVLAAITLLPFAIRALTAPAPTYLTAGENDIESGTVTETPQPETAFIGRAGEVVTVQLFDLLPSPAGSGAGDVQLGDIAGFADRAGQGLVNAARNRLAEAQTSADLENRRDTALLTDAQRAQVEEDLADLQISDPVTETYALNTAGVTVEIIAIAPDGTPGDVLASGLLAPIDYTASTPEAPQPAIVTATLPADGWYILRKTVEDEDASALLRATGIYPLLERDLGGNRVTYARATDDYETDAARPEIDGDDVPALFLVDTQYLGLRPPNDYLRLALAPFLDLLARAFVPMGAVAFVGYLAGSATTRADVQVKRTADLSPVVITRARNHAASQALVPYLWAVVLMALFILAAGARGFSSGEAGVFIARYLWVGFMFFAGAAIRTSLGTPLVGLGLVIGIGLSIFAERLDNAITINGLIALVVWLLVGAFAARQGVNQAQRFPARDALLGAGISFGVLALAAILPALVFPAENNLLTPVDTRRWGGFLLTIILTVTAIIGSFPIGILLALGRRSSLPAIKYACTLFIELVRGVPLITVLFMAQLIVPLVGGAAADADNIVRAIIGLTLFSAAYLAENVRGGLQSIPPGQEEAARALGLTGWQVTLRITLPQALRAVIPALVGQCIALFKDTSLVALVGLTDLTGIARAAIAQTEFIGLQTEVYVFISVIYFVFSYLMAYISRRIEASGSGAARRV